jgi:hypothetical protein
MRREPAGSRNGGRFAPDVSGRDNVPTVAPAIGEPPIVRSSDIPGAADFAAAYASTYERYLQSRAFEIENLTNENAALELVINDDVEAISENNRLFQESVDRNGPADFRSDLKEENEFLRQRVDANESIVTANKARIHALTAELDAARVADEAGVPFSLL